MRVVQTLSFAALWGALAVVPAAPAATLTYTDRAIWNSAVTNRTDVNFDSLSNGSYGSLTFGTAPDQVNLAGLGVVWMAVGSGWGPAGSGSYLIADDFGTGRRGLNVTHTSGLDTAFGVNLWTFDDQAQPIEIKVYSVGQPSSPAIYSVNTLSTSNPAIFFGYTSDDKIDHIEITTTGVRKGDVHPYAGRVVLDNYSWGISASQEQETPEATTIGYLTIGIAAMVFGKRKFARAE
ncbi:MAG: hypothetical protein LC126_17155 [Bryobacterales bacterium]|nr:hypothetical protein [Bryobacterales bacterium]